MAKTAKTAAPSIGTIGGYTIRRREPLDRIEGAYLELEHGLAFKNYQPKVESVGNLC